MSCLRCDREIHPDSPEIGSKHQVCTEKEKQCLRVNCACAECRSVEGVLCMFCEKPMRAGTKPYLKYICATCTRDSKKVDEFQEALRLAPEGFL